MFVQTITGKKILQRNFSGFIIHDPGSGFKKDSIFFDFQRF